MALENSGEVVSVYAELPVSLIQSRIVYLDIMSVAIKADLFHLEKMWKIAASRGTARRNYCIEFNLVLLILT